MNMPTYCTYFIFLILSSCFGTFASNEEKSKMICSFKFRDKFVFVPVLFHNDSTLFRNPAQFSCFGVGELGLHRSNIRGLNRTWIGARPYHHHLTNGPVCEREQRPVARFSTRAKTRRMEVVLKTHGCLGLEWSFI